jgi:hypothetical protein
MIVGTAPDHPFGGKIWAVAGTRMGADDRRCRAGQSKYPDRNELVAILTDETRRNPQTAMPPFGRNRILTEQEALRRGLA